MRFMQEVLSIALNKLIPGMIDRVFDRMPSGIQIQQNNWGKRITEVRFG